MASGRFVGHALDTNMDEEYDPQAYEYRGPYLASEDLADVHAVSEDAWESEVKAQAEDWDNAPDFRPPSVFRGSSKPAPNVDYAEANHLYISAGTMVLIEMIQRIARRVNFNPPKRGMSTTVKVKSVPIPVKEVPKPPKLIPVSKITGAIRKSKRIPISQLPLYKYRGWKEIVQ